MKNQKGNPNQIKPNELRIGNIISCSDGTHHTVSKFGNYKVRLGEITNQHGVKCWITSNIEDVAPIPLTEELLLKCGFEKSQIDLRSAYSPRAYVGLQFENGEFRHYKESNEWCYRATRIDNPIFLHQLQNLYFALTGEELKIELL